MSIKKLAKAINNAADAIRYHADKTGNETLPVEVSTSATKYKNIPKEVAPQALTESEANFVDPYDAPPPPPAGENDAPAKKEQWPVDVTVDAPGWQTLTVDDLNKKGAPVPEAPVPEAPVPEAPVPEAPVPEAPMTPSEKEAEPSEYDVTPPAAGGAELDSAGMPWDERIHSSGRSFLADGTWRLKRGVDDATMQAVTDELKQVMSVPTPPTADAPKGEIATLAQFVKACTTQGIGAMLVTAAVQEVGLVSVGQLGARPDLIPQVAAGLNL